MKHNSERPKLYIHVGEATHFLKWELPEFAKYFELVDSPDKEVPILVFGPDVLEQAIKLPSAKRYAVLFPGFGHNPLYSKETKLKHRELIAQYDLVFINPGPLEIAYSGLENIVFYPFSVDVKKIRYTKPRNKMKKIIHISSDYPQKDWQRSEEIMKRTGLKWEVYPRRTPNPGLVSRTTRRIKNFLYRYIRLNIFKLLPHGYVNHKNVIKKYKEYDAFIHVAKDIKDPTYIDGKYTATLIEAGLSGCVIFWHDTFKLGNTLESVFELPLNVDEAARMIKKITKTLDVKAHSIKTHQEMFEKFNPKTSVKIRADAILNSIKVS